MGGVNEFPVSCPEAAFSVETATSDNEFAVLNAETATQDNEFAALTPREQDDKDTAARQIRQAQRLKRNLLLQAAAAFLAAVVIHSSMGVDLLGSSPDRGLGESLEQILDSLGAGKGVITVSMIWRTADDLDLHVVTPGGKEVFYDNPQTGGGILDVDMQAFDLVDEPVENIYFETAERGTYNVYIVNFGNRTLDDSEALVRVSVNGKVTEYYVVIDEYRKFICSFTY